VPTSAQDVHEIGREALWIGGPYFEELATIWELCCQTRDA
jgi:hypothetical protein